MKKQPQLDNLAKCQNLANNNFLELRKHFKIKKAWDFGHHLYIATDKGSNYAYITTNPVDRLINSNHHPETLKDTTYIIGPDNSNRIVCFQWKHRYDSQNPLSDTRKVLVEKMRHEPYTDWDKSNPKWALYNAELAAFLKDNLVTQCLDKCRAKGNQNSAAQSARAKHSRTSQYQVELDFCNEYGRTVDIKDSILDAYRIAMTYGYNKHRQTFWRDLKAGKTIELDVFKGQPTLTKNGKTYMKKTETSLYIKLLPQAGCVTQPVNRLMSSINNYSDNIEKTLNKNNNPILDGLCNITREPSAPKCNNEKASGGSSEPANRAEQLKKDRIWFNSPDNLEARDYDWMPDCKRKRWDANNCFTFEEWKKQSYITTGE